MFLNAEAESESADIEAIKRYESKAASNPRGFQKSVVWMAALGYFAPFAILGALFAMTVFLLWLATISHVGAALALKIGVGVLALGAVIIRAMFIKFPPPSGIKLKFEEAPRLFDEIENVRRRVNGPTLHEVWLDDALNASIEQAPRFGLFGGHTNRLVIGLPLINALSKDQLISVIAHEYGHLAGAHGKTGAWIYRTRMLWARIDNLVSHSNSVFTGLLRAFVGWYAPLFIRMSFPLSRANEYEADRSAAEIAGKETFAAALIRIPAVASFLTENFWPDTERRVAASPEPDIQPQKAMADAFARAHEWKRAESWRRIALSEETGYADTHPSTSDRIAALGAIAPQLEPLNDRAADLLGETADRAADHFDETWRKAVGDNWSRRHEEATAAMKRLDELDRKGDSASAGEAIEGAEIAAAFISIGEAARRYLEAAKLHPMSATAWYGAGVFLASNDDPKAQGALEKAAELDPSLAVAGSLLAYRLLTGLGEHEVALTKLNQARELSRTTAVIMSQLGGLYKRDAIAPHRLSEEDRDKVIGVLRRIPNLKQAHMVRKTSEKLPSVVVFHLVLTPIDARNFDYGGATKAIQDLLLPGPIYFHFAVEQNFWMQREMTTIEGASIPI